MIIGINHSRRQSAKGKLPATCQRHRGECKNQKTEHARNSGWQHLNGVALKGLVTVSKAITT
jgi:hypothetical protein